MYTIRKVFNNNVILAVDRYKIETVLMGKGIGFSKSAGEKINNDKIQKTFKLHDSDMSRSLGQHLTTLSSEDYEITHRIVEYAKDYLKVNLSDYIYLSLSDHIEFSLERLDKGLILGNPLSSEVQNLYSSEYRVGLEALKIIEEVKGVRLPHEEAASIALHLINASEGSDSLNQLVSDLELIKQIIDIVANYFEIDFETPSLTFERFILHLKFFTWKLRQVEDYSTLNNNLFHPLKLEWKETYQCVLKISNYIEEKKSVVISENELFYLMVHIQRLTEREKNKN